jgi:protein subunit release factor A
MLPHVAEDEGNVILGLRSSMGGECAGDFAADLLMMSSCVQQTTSACVQGVGDVFEYR